MTLRSPPSTTTFPECSATPQIPQCTRQRSCLHTFLGGYLALALALPVTAHTTFNNPRHLIMCSLASSGSPHPLLLFAQDDQPSTQHLLLPLSPPRPSGSSTPQLRILNNLRWGLSTPMPTT
ncbi:hypothetical protein PtA15_8A142 [Puccinia triticina]|uniref:Uncharacterized protein n=1 Tax=Puccinia triticina TaxID=208348 RepID=A0ABY7CPQ5_9BASI|nr:uncharacterized protein PtA15_8A142 [Puccinia triticina]WAQ87239.1 hypothetical protein PtA15_8A142 [Puccinia triticina]